MIFGFKLKLVLIGLILFAKGIPACTHFDNCSACFKSPEFECYGILSSSHLFCISPYEIPDAKLLQAPSVSIYDYAQCENEMNFQIKDTVEDTTEISHSPNSWTTVPIPIRVNPANKSMGVFALPVDPKLAQKPTTVSNAPLNSSAELQKDPQIPTSFIVRDEKMPSVTVIQNTNQAMEITENPGKNFETQVPKRLFSFIVSASPPTPTEPLQSKAKFRTPNKMNLNETDFHIQTNIYKQPVTRKFPIISSTQNSVFLNYRNKSTTTNVMKISAPALNYTPKIKESPVTQEPHFHKTTEKKNVTPFTTPTNILDLKPKTLSTNPPIKETKPSFHDYLTTIRMSTLDIMYSPTPTTVMTTTDIESLSLSESNGDSSSFTPQSVSTTIRNLNAPDLNIPETTDMPIALTTPYVNPFSTEFPSTENPLVVQKFPRSPQISGHHQNLTWIEVVIYSSVLSGGILLALAVACFLHRKKIAMKMENSLPTHVEPNFRNSGMHLRSVSMGTGLNSSVDSRAQCNTL